jgi:hypothetical protein
VLDLLEQMLPLIFVFRKVFLVTFLHFLELQSETLDLLLVVAAHSLSFLLSAKDEKLLLLQG